MSDADLNFMEGFLCPICKKDLLNPDELLSHFEELHAEQDFYKSLFKELFGKAKKKLLKQNGSPEKISQQGKMGSFNSSFEYDVNQDLGWFTNHSEFFEKMRRERIDRMAGPTNQLILRLNKLLHNMPTDLLKKKAWEKSMVPWVDGTTVTRCPDCAGQFHLARRQHHCRTCGGIMCNNCSHFVPLNTARKIVDKELDSSENSQNSEMHLRLCIHCVSALESRERKRELSESLPIMGQIYNLLVEARIEAEQHLSTYLKMYNSLDAGESKYNLKDAQLLRVRLIKLAESIDSISEKIKSIGIKEEGKVEGKLCAGIKTAANNFLCTRLLSLPNLPSEEELEEKQQRRSEKVQEEVERRRAADIKQRQPSIAMTEIQTSPNGQSDEQQKVVSVGQGWVPIERKNKVNEEDDPLIQQMNIIRFYIKQAQLANRIDEVVSLEKNLQELKEEFWRKQSAQEDFARPDNSKDEVKLTSDENPSAVA